MKITAYKNELRQILKDYYNIIQVRFSVYDKAYNKILAYPETSTQLCEFLHSTSTGAAKCLESNYQAFNTCNKTKTAFIYKCYMGLSEIAVPIIMDSHILGYVIIGQVTSDLFNKENLKTLSDRILKYSANKNFDINKLISDVELRTDSQLLSLARILEACTHYILLKNAVTIDPHDIWTHISLYVDTYITDKITLETLTNRFNISRTKMYQLFEENTGTSVASYIRNKRLSLAYEMLYKTDKTIQEIAESVGIPDYNYFSTVFKKAFGNSPSKLRKAGKRVDML